MRPAAAKWLRRISFAVIGALLIAIAALAWLLGTSAGARFAIGFVEERLPLQFAEVDGSLLGTLELRGVTYDDVALRADIDAAEISVAAGVLWNFRRVTVDRLAVNGVRIRLGEGDDNAPPVAEGFVLPRMPSVSLPLSLSLVDLRIEDLLVLSADERELLNARSLQFSGNWSDEVIDVETLTLDAVQASASLTGRLSLNARLPLDLELDWSVPATQPHTAAGSLQISGSRDDYRISHVLVAPLDAQTNGGVSLPEAAPVSVDLVTRTSTYALALAGRDVTFGDIELAVNGGWQDWRLRFDSAVETAELAPGRLSLTAAGDGVEATIDEAVLTFTDGVRLVVNGDVALTDGAAWDLRVAGTRLPLRLASPGLAGEADALMQVAGEWGARKRVAADIDRLDGTLRDVPFTASGNVEWRPVVTKFDALTAVVGDNRLRIDGSIDAQQTADLVIEARADALSQLLPDLDGDLTLDGRVFGSIEKPGADLRLQSGGIAWRDLAVGAARATARLDGAAVALDLTAASLRNGGLSATDIALSVAGQQAAHSIALRGSVQGNKPLSVAANGGYADGAWRGRLESLLLSAPGFAASPQLTVELQSPTSVAVAANDLRIDDFCLSTTLSRELCGRVRFADGSVDASLSVAGVALETLIPESVTGIRWTGEAVVNASLQGPLPALDGSASVRFDGLLASKGEGDALSELAFDEAGLTLTLRSGALSMAGGALLPYNGRLGLDLSLGDLRAEDAPLAGKLTLATDDLSAANALLDTFQVSGGMLNGVIEVSGTRSAPSLSSRINVSSLQARVVALGIVVEDVSLSAVNVASDTLRFTGGGRSGEGSFTIAGETRIDAQRQLTTTANVKATTFTFVDLPDRFGVASMEVSVKADPRELVISGPLSVDRADVTVRALPEGAVQLSSDERIIAGDGIDTVERVRLTQKRLIDVTVTLSDDVSLQGFGLTTGLAGQLRLRQRRTTALQGFGTLRLQDATYTAYGQKLDVSRGNLVFNGPLESPLLDFRAERSIDSTQVGIDIRGTPDALESSLFSSPSLPEAEIFSLLLTGRSLSSAGQAEGSAMADAAITLGLRQAFGVSSAIRDVVGLDTLTVVGSGRDGRVLAGKQISPNLYLQYAYGVFDQLSTVLLRLRLNERLSLESSTGEDQSVDLIYSVGRN